MAPPLGALAKGERIFCNWDEDAVTMAVEACRDALEGVHRPDVQTLMLVSTRLPYADLQNATLVGSALRLAEGVRTADLGHSQRASTSSLRLALESRNGHALVVAADRPVARPGSVQELLFGAGAAALRLGTTNVVARLRGAASSSVFFVDHFRSTDKKYDYQWEERWIREEGYLKLIPPVVKQALTNAEIGIADCQYLVLGTAAKGMADAVAKKMGFTGNVVSGLQPDGGYAGTAQSLLLLADTLANASAGDRIVLLGFGQGCDALVLEATEALPALNARKRGARSLVGKPISTDAYMRFLSFEGGVDLEWGMRAETVTKTSLTEQYRSSANTAGFVAGRCNKCGTVQFPMLEYCVSPKCAAPAGAFVPESLSELRGKLVTHTADWLSYYPAPPLYVGFVQFDNGARVQMEMADVDSHGIEVGKPVRMVYRIKERDVARGYDRYFWKATPLALQEEN
jgi:3-hydroxy-3-methylglutaryl CoA synthase